MKLSFIFLACSICVLRAEEENTAPANYQFNHPPSAEDYGPIIDVAVVYDDDVQLKSKSVDQEETVDKDQVVATTEAEEPSSSPKSELPKPVLVPKPRALNNFEIPVAVVYDNVNSLKTEQVSQQRPKGVRRRLKKRKQQKPKESIKEVENPTVAHEIPKPVSKAIPVRNPLQRAPIQTTTYVPVVSNAAKSKPTARERNPIVPIIESENHVYSHNGNFHYSYEGGDGTKAFSDGQLLRTEDDKAAGEGVVGGFSYTDKDGNDFSLSYTADENGYRPVGAHLPTPPPIPPAIARALAYLATATTPEPVTKPSKIKQE